MRVTIFTLFLLFLSSCAFLGPDKKEVVIQETADRYMTPDQVVSEFKRLGEEKAEMAERLSDDALARLKNLLPAEDLISPDQMKVIEEQRKNALAKKLDLKIEEKATKGYVDRRSCDNPAISQCGGTCTSHGVSNAIDNFICRPDVQNASNQDLWDKYKRYSQSAAVAAALKEGICEEKDWPNCGSEKSSCKGNRHIKLVKQRYLGRDFEEAKMALDQGHSIVYAGKVTRSWVNCDPVINPKSSALGGGHSVAVVGYKEDPDVLGGGYFILLNSWGQKCGDSGYQYIPFHYCNRTDRKMYCSLNEIVNAVSKNERGTPGNYVPPKPPVCRWVKYCYEKRNYWVFWKKAYKTVCYKKKVCTNE